VSVIAAEPVFTRRLPLVPLRAEHADEMAAVLAGPDLYIFTRGEPAHAAGVACTLPTLDRRHNPADHPAPRDRQPSAGPGHRRMDRCCRRPGQPATDAVRGRPVPAQRPIKGYVGVEAFRARIQV
jgi:hypothetical protein